MRDEYTISFPDNLQIKSAPKDVIYRDGGLSSMSRYSLSVNTLHINREFKTERMSMVCDQLNNDKNHNLFKVMQRDFRSQVIYE